jgi:lipopolysaccharide transport system permease protein
VNHRCEALKASRHFSNLVKSLVEGLAHGEPMVAINSRERLLSYSGQECGVVNKKEGSGMLGVIRELIKYRELLFIIAWRDIVVKYKQAVMGIMWAIFVPLIVVSAGILVKYGMSLLSNKPLVLNDIACVSVKSLPWAFFVSSIRFSTNSLTGNASLITKVYCPRLVFPIAAILAQAPDFFIAAFVMSALLWIGGLGGTVYILWAPVLICVLIILAAGIGIIMSALNLYYRDVKYIVEVILTFAIFVTPVFYEVGLFQRWSRILMLNPVAPLLEGLTNCIVYQRAPANLWLLYSVVLSFSILFLSVMGFRKLEGKFAERI